MADDQLVLDLSAQQEYPAPFVRNSEWLWTTDQTGGIYTAGTCILDTSSLSNSNKWLNYQSAYLAIPQRIRCTADAALDNLNMGTFMAGIKSGFHNTINSCQVEINGVTVQQSTNYSNMIWSYRLLTSLSYNDLTKVGSSIGFYPDDSNSWTYNAADSADGITATFSNNRNGGYVDVSAANAAGAGVGFNNGFLQRQKWLSYNAAPLTGHVGAATETNLYNMFKSYVTYQEGDTATPTVSEVIFNMIAIVRLRDICPLFAQLGLCKGLLARLTLTLNQPTFSVTNNYTAAVAAQMDAIPPISVNITPAVPSSNVFTAVTAVSYPYGGNTNPIMVASGATGSGFANVLDCTTLFELRIGATPFSAALQTASAAQAPFGQGEIRFWIQSCILAPEQEAELIANPIRQIKYADIYETEFTVDIAGSANQQLFNGVPRCRRLIMVPLQEGGSSNVFDGQGGGCTLPMAGLTNLQVYMSGMPLFPTALSYDYRMYLEQFAKSGINYGMVEGVSSGLIGQDQWENNYRYYVVDLHQGIESEDDVTKNIQVSFTSQSAVAMRMYCFVEYERILELNILSSAIIAFK